MSRISAAAERASTSSGGGHFALFGLEPAFAIDLERLERTYREIQSRVHPDRFAQAGDAERRASLQWTTRVNEAYRALRDPVQRAVHLLALQGVDVAFETNTAMPQEFLARQMELREQLEAALSARDAARLGSLQSEMAAEKRRLAETLGQRIDADRDYPGAAALVREMKFLEKVEAEIDSAYEEMD